MFQNMARQMAQLLANSDLEELGVIVDRWIAEAPTEQVREQYVRFGRQMIDLKSQISLLPVSPTQQELETTLEMMLHLAAQEGGRHAG